MIDRLGIRQHRCSRAANYPDARSFRMYRDLGLVDAPHGKSGASGVYGSKHVLQLVAIKRMQSEFMPLREIHARMKDAGGEGLRDILRGEVRKSGAPPPATLEQPSREPESTRWIRIELADGAYAMVEAGLLRRSRPSSLRALSESLHAGLLRHRETEQDM